MKSSKKYAVGISILSGVMVILFQNFVSSSDFKEVFFSDGRIMDSTEFTNYQQELRDAGYSYDSSINEIVVVAQSPEIALESIEFGDLSSAQRFKAIIESGPMTSEQISDAAEQLSKNEKYYAEWKRYFTDLYNWANSLSPEEKQKIAAIIKQIVDQYAYIQAVQNSGNFIGNNAEFLAGFDRLLGQVENKTNSLMAMCISMGMPNVPSTLL